jgi:hypothetical protein
VTEVLIPARQGRAVRAARGSAIVVPSTESAVPLRSVSLSSARLNHDRKYRYEKNDSRPRYRSQSYESSS